jgi:hypothetical protein
MEKTNEIDESRPAFKIVSQSVTQLTKELDAQVISWACRKK